MKSSMNAKNYIMYDKFLKGKYTKDFYNRIFDGYRYAVVDYYNELCVSGAFAKIDVSIKRLFEDIFSWLEFNRQDVAVGCGGQKNYNISSLADLANKRTAVWGTGSAALRLLDEYHISLKEKDYFINGNLKSGQTSIFCEKRYIHQRMWY